MKVTVIGAGLSGLAITLRLQQAGVEVSLIEASSVAGGRIQPAFGNSDDHQAERSHQDCGPSWVWPYAQPSVVSWFEELGLETFDQFVEGDCLIDAHPEQPAKRQFVPSQHGMVRVVGGTHALIKALLAKITVPIKYSSIATRVVADKTSSRIDCELDGVSNSVEADKIIIALPPRLAASLVATQSGLDAVVARLHSTPTWMAQQAKIVMHYEAAFWRESGLSGRVVSHVGPLVEIHDHCGPDATPAALFGFSGVPAVARKQLGNAAIIDAVQQQLQRCFGSGAPKPIRIQCKDWAQENFTCASADLAGPVAHPQVGSQLLRQGWVDNRVWFAASETSAVSPGLIEGALARADHVVTQVLESL